MKQDKYIAFYAANCESETFETFEEAEKWLTDGYETDIDEGFSEETINGFDYIAKITHRSEFIESANSKDYWKYEEEEGKDEWPYDNDFDVIGNITLERVN